MIDWKLKPLIPTYDIENNDFYYDLTDGGYIKPSEFLDDENQIEKLQEAIDIVNSFEACLIENCSKNEETE